MMDLRRHILIALILSTILLFVSCIPTRPKIEGNMFVGLKSIVILKDSLLHGLSKNWEAVGTKEVQTIYEDESLKMSYKNFKVNKLIKINKRGLCLSLKDNSFQCYIQMKNPKKKKYKNYSLEMEIVSAQADNSLNRCGFYINNPRSEERTEEIGGNIDFFEGTSNLPIVEGEAYRLKVEVFGSHYKLYFNDKVEDEKDCTIDLNSNEIGIYSCGRNYMKNFKFVVYE